MSIGYDGDDPYEKLVVDVEIRLPDAVIKADLETKTVMVGRLIKQLAIRLGPLEQNREVENLREKTRAFLREGDGTEWGECFPRRLLPVNAILTGRSECLVSSSTDRHSRR